MGTHSSVLVNMSRSMRVSSTFKPTFLLSTVFIMMVFYLGERQTVIDKQIFRLLESVSQMESSQLSLLDEQFQLNLDANKTEKSIKSHEGQIDLLEQYVNKYNLKFYGIEEESGETEIDLEEKIRKILEKMEIILQDKDIEFVERITEAKSSPRPVRVKFSRWKDRTKIFYKKRSMPDGISVDEDLTEKQVYDKEKLRRYAQEAEDGGKSIRWQGKQLYV